MGFPSNKSVKEGYSISFFTAICLSSMKTVADRHRDADYHNKHYGDELIASINIDDLERL